MIDAVSSKTTSLISQLEDEMATPKLKKRILALYEVLNNIGCLQDVSEKEHDSE